MRIIFTILLLLATTWGKAQTQQNEVAKDVAYIQSFLTDLKNENRAVDLILSQYVIVNEPSDELYDYLEVSLEEIRINMLTKNIVDIQCIPYNKIASKETRDIDIEDLNKEKIYILYHKKRQLTALYLEDGKIASFTLVSKGNNKAHFVRY